MRAGVLTTPGRAYSAPVGHGTQLTGQVHLTQLESSHPSLPLRQSREKEISLSQPFIEKWLKSKALGVVVSGAGLWLLFVLLRGGHRAVRRAPAACLHWRIKYSTLSSW